MGSLFDFPIFPEQASNFAGEMDALYFLLWLLTITFTVLVAIMVLVFSVRYRRGSRVDRSKPVNTHHGLELTWSIIPLLLGLGVFVWAAKLFANVYSAPPANSMEVFVIGKQWMWHLQHSNGVRENNELHVPLGQPVKLTMISQDVIHDFFVPDFRIKRDVVPGRYTQVWFIPTKVGKYHLFCAEFCGTQHSLMGGWVYVMKPDDFQDWLNHGGPRNTTSTPTLADVGKSLYQDLACDNCHGAKSTERGPSLYGLYGKQVKLASGESVAADNAFLRDAILNPSAHPIAGYPNDTMPAYKGQVNEEQVLQLIAYIKSLGAPDPAMLGQGQPASKPTSTGTPTNATAPAGSQGNSQGKQQ